MQELKAERCFASIPSTNHNASCPRFIRVTDDETLYPIGGRRRLAGMAPTDCHIGWNLFW